MNMSTELLVGIILIALGILLGAAAYMVLSSRKDASAEEVDDEDALEGEDEDQELPESAVVEAEAEADLEGDAELEEDTPLTDDPSVDDQAEPETPVDEDSQGDQAPEGTETSPPEEDGDPDLEEQVPESEPYMPEPEAGPRIQVASLLRDEVTGTLIVKVGDREYRSADELRDSGDWTRVEFAASDLSKWIDQPIERPSLERESESSDRAKPMSMIEQINQILQDKIESSGKSHLAVRLIEGMEGTARVLIGVHSYELGEVPDESINILIREAVAEWEARS